MSGGWGAPSSFGPQVTRSAGMDLSVEDRQSSQLMQELLGQDVIADSAREGYASDIARCVPSVS